MHLALLPVLRVHVTCLNVFTASTISELSDLESTSLVVTTNCVYLAVEGH